MTLGSTADSNGSTGGRSVFINAVVAVVKYGVVAKPILQTQGQNYFGQSFTSTTMNECESGRETENIDRVYTNTHTHTAYTNIPVTLYQWVYPI